MGVLDVLFGRKRLQKPAEDRLFAIVTAGVTLEHSLGLRFDGVGAVVFKPLSAAEFARVEGEVDELPRPPRRRRARWSSVAPTRSATSGSS